MTPFMKRKLILAGLGVATVDGGYAAVAVVAGTAVARALEPVSEALTAASVAVLLAVNPAPAADPPKVTAPPESFFDRVGERDRAAALRAHLTAGHDCPVCA